MRIGRSAVAVRLRLQAIAGCVKVSIKPMRIKMGIKMSIKMSIRQDRACDG